MTLTDYITTHQNRFKQEFLDLLRIPSISTDAIYAEHVKQAATWIADEMQRIGLIAELVYVPEGRHPLVIGRYNEAGDHAKTVLVYCHYDVQPAEIDDGWQSDPFEPVEREGKLYARGATDSKVHVMAWLKAVETLLATDGCPVNLILAFEGEEESGSESITAYINAHPDRLRADVAVISDGSILSPEQPSILYALRGIMTLDVHVFGPQHDLHSGIYGGTVHNPIQALAEILAALHDTDGRVTVPGFYDAVLPLSDDERRLLQPSGIWLQAEWQAVARAPQPWGEAGYALQERVGARPTLEINGIAGGYAGNGFKTVLPAEAYAKISCRLVANQDPRIIAQQVQAYIEQLAPPSVRVEFRHVDMSGLPVVLNTHSQAMRAAKHAYTVAWGIEPVFERAGGSVPITHTIRQISDDITVMGFSYKGGNAHGPNENILLSLYDKGIHAAITFLQTIADET